MFEAVRDEEMEQLLLSPEKLRDAGRSPSVRRAFEELRAASVASKTPTQSGTLCTAVLDCPLAASTLQPAASQAGLVTNTLPVLRAELASCSSTG